MLKGPGSDHGEGGREGGRWRRWSPDLHAGWHARRWIRKPELAGDEGSVIAVL